MAPWPARAAALQSKLSTALPAAAAICTTSGCCSAAFSHRVTVWAPIRFAFLSSPCSPTYQGFHVPADAPALPTRPVSGEKPLERSLAPRAELPPPRSTLVPKASSARTALENCRFPKARGQGTPAIPTATQDRHASQERHLFRELQTLPARMHPKRKSNAQRCEPSQFNTIKPRSPLASLIHQAAGASDGSQRGPSFPRHSSARSTAEATAHGTGRALTSPESPVDGTARAPCSESKVLQGNPKFPPNAAREQGSSLIGNLSTAAAQQERGSWVQMGTKC